MKSTLRKIGNSRGVLIPEALLAGCSIEDEIEIRLDRGRIVIAPVRASVKAPRAGWFDGYIATADAPVRAENSLAMDSEWTW